MCVLFDVTGVCVLNYCTIKKTLTLSQSKCRKLLSDEISNESKRSRRFPIDFLTLLGNTGPFLSTSLLTILVITQIALFVLESAVAILHKIFFPQGFKTRKP